MPNSIHEDEFAQTISLRDAYRAMESFLLAYHRRGESSTAILLGDVCLDSEGRSGDPAALSDFLESALEARASSPQQPKGTAV